MADAWSELKSRDRNQAMNHVRLESSGGVVNMGGSCDMARKWAIDQAKPGLDRGRSSEASSYILEPKWLCSEVSETG